MQNMTTIQFSRFTDAVWASFSGSERFSDGSDPLYGELTVGGKLACAVLDKSGLSVIVSCISEDDMVDDETVLGESEVWTWSPELALTKMWSLRTVMESVELL